MNVVIKQFILLKNINDNIFKLLIKYLERYQNLLSKFIDTVYTDEIIFYKNQRNFFFDFLLNPKLYVQSAQFDLKGNINMLFDSIFQIIENNVIKYFK